MSDAIDWTKWLPPYVLADNRVERKAGQLFVQRWDTRADAWRVFRALEDGIDSECMVIAGHSAGGHLHVNAKQLLIQDVHESAPRDPRVLYTPARADGWPGPCIVCGADKGALGLSCPPCWNGRFGEVIALDKEWRRIRMSAPAPKVAEPCKACGRLPVVANDMCRPCSDAFVGADPAPTVAAAKPAPTRAEEMATLHGCLRCGSLITRMRKICIRCEACLLPPPPAPRPSRVVGVARDCIGEAVRGHLIAGMRERPVRR